MRRTGTPVMSIGHPRSGRGRGAAPQKPGGWAVIVGPDGVGKTTVARLLVRAYGGAAAYFHFRPSGSSPMSREPEDLPFQILPKPSRTGSWALSIVRLIRSVLLFWWAYLAHVRPAIKRGELVVGDRWGYNYLVQPHSVRYYGPRFLARLFVLLLPRPDIVFNMRADPTVIHQRKGELSPPEIEQELRWWDELPVPRVVMIDATLTPDEVVERMLTALGRCPRSHSILGADRSQ